MSPLFTFYVCTLLKYKVFRFGLFLLVERKYSRHHTCNNLSLNCCLASFSETEKEECLCDFPAEIIKQNQYVLNLLYQFGNPSAENEEELENVTFMLLGKKLCEECLCVLFNISNWRYQRVKDFYRNHIFAKCPQCQGLRKKCFECGKNAAAISALKDERKKHKDLYMAEKQDYYNRQVVSVHQPDDLLSVIYDGMHKEKTKLPRYSKNAAKDLESMQRIPCSLLGLICHRQGSNDQFKQGTGFLNLGCYSENANYILSALVHLLANPTSTPGPFSRNLSLQFDNASNNKCSLAVSFFGYLISEDIFHNVYGNTLIVHHTHEDIDRMFENANKHFRKEDVVTPCELSDLMKTVPYVTDVDLIPCVWDLEKFLQPFVRTVHDFANVHHFWVHKNAEGNVVLHHKRYAKDQWNPRSDDHSSFISEEDRHGVLLFKAKPQGIPSLVEPVMPINGEDMDVLKSNINKMFEHPLLQDSKLDKRKQWWSEFLAGESIKPQKTIWPLDALKKRRMAQNQLDNYQEGEAVQGLEYCEEEIPTVYSGQYLNPLARQTMVQDQLALRNGQWPIKKIVKERVNARTHRQEFLVDWKPSWVDAHEVQTTTIEEWQHRKRKSN
ncbi:uncharacterized protein [Porites lutea]|uniref:uncharacterized protein isoform X3 n=1 Tax=Porites lutea TaxID=51062 RepID=UPI003CC66425